MVLQRRAKKIQSSKQEAVAYNDTGTATDTTGSSKGVEGLGLPDDE